MDTCNECDRTDFVNKQWHGDQQKKGKEGGKRWTKGIRRTMSVRNLREGEWMTREEWRLRIGQR